MLGHHYIADDVAAVPDADSLEFGLERLFRRQTIQQGQVGPAERSRLPEYAEVYPFFSATVGSTRVALRAGPKLADVATPPRIAAIEIYVTGSVRLM